ncbi:MAG: hypothetical protein ING75_07685 [Rhodocyclaceae bacterium]|nr:hypothetical protein [Rhodocyclaceae bacterium]
MKNGLNSFLVSDGGHFVQLLYPNFGLGCSKPMREVVSLLASVAIIAIILSALVAAIDARWKPSWADSQLWLPRDEQGFFVPPFDSKYVVCIVFGIGLAVGIRMMTFVYVRFSRPYNWLLAPLPLAIALVYGCYAVTIRISAATFTPIKYAGSMPIAPSGALGFFMGNVTAVCIYLLYLWCFRNRTVLA